MYLCHQRPNLAAGEAQAGRKPCWDSSPGHLPFRAPQHKCDQLVRELALTSRRRDQSDLQRARLIIPRKVREMLAPRLSRTVGARARAPQAKIHCAMDASWSLLSCPASSFGRPRSVLNSFIVPLAVLLLAGSPVAGALFYLADAGVLPMRRLLTTCDDRSRQMARNVSL